MSVQYGDKDFFVNDTFSDSLTFQGELLLQMSRSWQTGILNEIRKCDESAEAVGMLEINLAKAQGRKADGINAKERFFNRIDQPFRQWLAGISPETDDISDCCQKLEEIVQTIGKNLGQNMVIRSRNNCFFRQNDRGQAVLCLLQRYITGFLEDCIKFIINKEVEKNGKAMEQIKEFAEKKFRALRENPDESAIKADLAKMRRGVGKAPGTDPIYGGFYLKICQRN